MIKNIWRFLVEDVTGTDSVHLSIRAESYERAIELVDTFIRGGMVVTLLAPERMTAAVHVTLDDMDHL